MSMGHVMLSVLVWVMAASAVAAAPLWVVELDPGRGPAELEALRSEGGAVLAHLGPGRVLVASAAITAEGDGVRRWRAGEALSPAVRSLAPVTAKRFASGVPMIVAVSGDRGATELVERLAAVGVDARWRARRPLWVELGFLVEPQRWDEARRALPGEGLVWADLQPPVRLRNRASVWRCQSGVAGQTPIFDRGLLGEGEVIGIMDTGLDVDMCYFHDDQLGLPALNDDLGIEVDPAQRKVLAVDFWWTRDWPDPSIFQWDDQGHGSHVAGSAAGDGGVLGAHDGDDGMAPAARLVIQDGGFAVDDCADLPGLGCPTRSLEPMLQQAWDQGARIHSNSWGDEENTWPPNSYTERTADVDRFVWQHPEMTVLFAAGNAGQWGDDSVGSPATGKNLIAVGASWHGDIPTLCPAGFSSRGWTADGRIKPDIMAPGQSVSSALTDYRIDSLNCGVAQSSGTSMACPTAAGLAALVRQYYREGHHPHRAAFEPTAALVKATLIASAVDMTTLGCPIIDPIPSRDQGWGVIQLDRALFFSGDEATSVVLDRPAEFSGTEGAVELALTTGTGGWLKAVLVWTDPPSSSLAATNLVNDLDLVVEGPTGIYRGNVLADGVSVEGGVADARNNVEVVWLPEVPPGTWRVTVSPTRLVEGPQGFALVVTGHLEVPGRRRPGGRVAPSAVAVTRPGSVPDGR